MPCLVLNNILDEPINYISVNNRKAAIEIMEYFIHLGHRNIATVAGDISTQSGVMRLEGYKEALRKHDIRILNSYIKFGD